MCVASRVYLPFKSKTASRTTASEERRDQNNRHSPDSLKKGEERGARKMSHHDNTTDTATATASSFELDELTKIVDVGWVLICTALVFLMQGGFILVREKDTRRVHALHSPPRFPQNTSMPPPPVT